MMVQFCYSRLYLGTETVSCACGLLLRKANLVPGRVISLCDPGIEVDRHGLKLEKNWTNFRKYASMPAQISKKIILCQEPINRNEQLPCTLATAFSPTSLFLKRFWRKFSISLRSKNKSSKQKDQKKIFWPKTISHPLLVFWCFESAHWGSVPFIFARKKCCKIYLRIKRPAVRTRWH